MEGGEERPKVSRSGAVVNAVYHGVCVAGGGRSLPLPPWKCGWYSARWVQVLIITLFCAAALYAVLDLVGILPSGW